MTPSETGQEILDRYRSLVDSEIGRALAAREDLVLYDMVRYHLGFAEAETGVPPGHRGKQVRAALCMLACAAAGGEATAAAPAAAAVELLHSFTLLHDDIADRDELRRGRQTVWRRWGVGSAITAGDGLFALANLALCDLERAGVAADTVSAIARELNEAALVVCEGQQLDLAYEGRTDVSVDDYLRMVERKTAALFAASTAIGARIAGASREMTEALRSFGHHAGVGYQIRDDVLGIWGDPRELGKPLGSDLRRNKRSLPVVHALGAAEAKERAELAGRLARGIPADEEAAEVAARLEKLGAREFCEHMARESLERALDALKSVPLPEETARELRILATYLMERTN